MSIINLELGVAIDILASSLNVSGQTNLKDLNVSGQTILENLIVNNIIVPDLLVVNNLIVEDDLTVGTLANNNNLNINSKNIFINEDANMKLQDNDSNALKITANSKDILKIDTTTSSEKVEIDGQLDVTGNVNCEEILVSRASLLGSIGWIKIAQGNQIYTTEGPGVNPIIFSGLDSTLDERYMLRFSYRIQSTNVNFFFKININNDFTNEYSYSTDINGVITSFTVQAEFPLLQLNFVGEQFGSGVFVLSRKLGLLNEMCAMTSATAKIRGAGNPPKFISMSSYYENTAIAKILSFQIDVNNSNHLFSRIEFELFKQS